MSPITRHIARALFALFCLLISSIGYAQQCPAPAFVYEPGNAVVQGADTSVQALADRLSSENGLISLDGNTSIQYQGRTIESENALYNAETGEVVINGDLTYESRGVQVNSNGAKIFLNDDRFSTGESSYDIDNDGNRANGNAGGIERRDDGSLVLKDATYTTCPRLDNSWFIKANRIELYPDDGIGIAKNIVLRFKGVPILALPVFSFPITNDRKTGFLAPTIGQGDNTGFEFQLPYYVNIRPNIDATFTPRFMSKRGIQLQTELRYLNRQGMWTLDSEILSDRTFPGRDRRFTQLIHDGNFGPLIRTHINASDVTDSEYFDDLGNSLQSASISHLEREAEVVYEWQDTKAAIRLQGFQTVDPLILAEDRPYDRLPQLTFSTRAPIRPLGLDASFASEAVFFNRRESVRGLRVDAIPRLSLPLRGAAWFFTPSLSQRFTHYRLDGTAEGQSSQLTRNLPTVSVDSGLFFDRLLNDEGSVLTLEPRLFYLYVPFVDQDELPVFDSSEFDFNVAQLFRENRFAGADRVADANQISLALTSRLINGDDGREVWRGSVGQIFFFEDRRVSLEGVDLDDPVDTSGTSDFVGELSRDFSNHVSVQGNIQFSPQDDNTVRSSILLTYRPDKDRIINVSHRRVNNGTTADTEQVDFSFLWPVTDNIRLAGRWNYSLADNTDIESLIGIEYDSCCYALRFAARRYISDDGLDHDNSLYLQLVLKGLAPLGQDYGNLLEFSILGYRDDVE